MQICYECHEYHDSKQDVCNFCSKPTLIDAEIEEEHLEECLHEAYGGDYYANNNE